MFKISKITDIVFVELQKFSDQRGWLTELHRKDELSKNLNPEMSYISMTFPKIVRGPHEHKKQIDYMIFTGGSTFKIFLWDMRLKSKSYKSKQILIAKENKIFKLIVPAGVVHAYKNIGLKNGFVINLPNKLYKGKNKKSVSDEIRHENDSQSIFKIK